MKTNKPALDIKIGKDRDVLYAKVRPHTKEFFELQKEQAGARSLGEYFDALAAKLKEM